MNDRPQWFAPKRYGYGAGLPISWQGWAVTVAFIALGVHDGADFFGDRPVVVFAIADPGDDCLPHRRRKNDARRLALALGRSRLALLARAPWLRVRAHRRAACASRIPPLGDILPHRGISARTSASSSVGRSAGAAPHGSPSSVL